MRQRIAGGTRDAGPFKAYRVTSFPTLADRDARTNGAVRYALTKREARDVAPVIEEVEVTLREGHFKLTASYGGSGITDAGGLIGLDQAIRKGIAAVRDLTETVGPAMTETRPAGTAEDVNGPQGVARE